MGNQRVGDIMNSQVEGPQARLCHEVKGNRLRELADLYRAVHSAAQLPNLTRGSRSEEQQMEIEALVEPLIDQLARIAWKVSGLQAEGVDEIAMKAGVLRHWCDAGSGALLDTLAISVCDDLDRIARARH